MSQIKVIDLGIIEYSSAFEKQKELFDDNIRKKNQAKETANTLIVCEHPHIYTLGKNGDENNLLVNSEFLNRVGATYFQTDRGGDITYHGPGQIVIYPIFDLDNFGIGTRNFIMKMEYAIIDILKEYNIEGQTYEKYIGVWIEPLQATERKICAIGVKVSKGITMHGLALNVNTDLSYFEHINPCGFTNKGVTSIKKELGKDIDYKEVKNILIEKLIQKFNNH